MAMVVTSAACASAIRRDVVAASPTPAMVESARPNTTFDRWFAEGWSSVSTTERPSHVEIVGASHHYQYVVNGERQVIKCMGLNTQYSQQLTPTERARQLDSDTEALRTLGINTVLGWDPAEFDNVLLDAAQKHGIGVVMPFDLDPRADYTDPAVRQQLYDQVLDWVARYRSHPALRMWGFIRRNPDWVLGGAVYAWTRNGPEGVDRNFGLTDDGAPVDGRSLDMLNALFHTE